jgi:two-component system, response regulator, stage 0 sporulation protein F
LKVCHAPACEEYFLIGVCFSPFSAPTPDLTSPRTMGARTILIIDDQPSVRVALEYVFTSHGMTVVLAASGSEALASPHLPGCDAALIDLIMPGMDGFSVSAALRDQASLAKRDLLVWMMTGAYTTTAATRAIQAGAVNLLAKPFDCSEVLRQLEGLIEASRVRNRSASDGAEHPTEVSRT